MGGLVSFFRPLIFAGWALATETHFLSNLLITLGLQVIINSFIFAHGCSGYDDQGWQEDGDQGDFHDPYGQPQYGDPYGYGGDPGYDGEYVDGEYGDMPAEEDDGFVDCEEGDAGYVPKFIPALDDMLLLVQAQPVLDHYGYKRPVPVVPRVQQQTQNRGAAPGAREVNTLPPLPPLDSRRWTIDQCELLVNHFRFYLKAILKDALTVKNLDLLNTPANVTQEIFMNTGNQLKPTREIAATIQNINSGNDRHNRAQQEVASFTETMIASGVKMLRTALSITKRELPPSQFNTDFAPFFQNARALLDKLNEVHWNTGPQVFTKN